MYYMYVRLVPVEAKHGTKPRYLQKQKYSEVLSHLSSPFSGLSSWTVEPRVGIVGSSDMNTGS